MRILVAPLDWGLGHATRCIPIIYDLIKDGNEVVLGGDGESLALLRREFPGLWCRYIPSFKIRYSKGNSQVFAMLRALPSIIYNSIKEHREIKRIVKDLEIDRVISDNRFGLFGSGVHSTYITHQLMIKMPRGFGWLEGVAHKLHKFIIEKFDECWVPDYDDKEKSLAGDLTHKYPLPSNAQFIGPLSRFTYMSPFVESCKCDILAIISGVEPQRSMFEHCVKNKYPNAIIAKNMTSLQLLPYILGADKICAFSGYTTIMDMHLLGKSDIMEWTPTPGQTEQEYLYEYLKN